MGLVESELLESWLLICIIYYENNVVYWDNAGFAGWKSSRHRTSQNACLRGDLVKEVVFDLFALCVRRIFVYYSKTKLSPTSSAKV